MIISAVVEHIENSMTSEEAEALNREFETYKNDLKKSEVHRVDYLLFLDELGITDDEARKISECGNDLLNMPGPVHPYEVKASFIDGDGYFLTHPAKVNDLLAPLTWYGMRTPAGVFVNHSKTPNAKIAYAEDGNFYLKAIDHIDDRDDEVTINYRHTEKLMASLVSAGQIYHH